jgi:hypothetical protein
MSFLLLSVVLIVWFALCAMAVALCRMSAREVDAPSPLRETRRPAPRPRPAQTAGLVGAYRPHQRLQRRAGPAL